MKRGTAILTATVYWWLLPTAMVVVVMVAAANAARDYLNGDYLGREDGHTSKGDSEGLFRAADE